MANSDTATTKAEGKCSVCGAALKFGEPTEAFTAANLDAGGLDQLAA